MTNNIISKATGKHSSEKSQRISDLTITILEKVFNSDKEKKCG